jgi:fatty acid desaturase
MARDLRKQQGEAVRITTAASNRLDDIATRQKRYLISMTLRSLCFVGAIIAALAGIGWLWPILIAGALILPYIAVVMANAVMTKDDGTDLLDGRYVRELDAAPERRRTPDMPGEDTPHP